MGEGHVVVEASAFQVNAFNTALIIHHRERDVRIEHKLSRNLALLIDEDLETIKTVDKHAKPPAAESFVTWHEDRVSGLEHLDRRFTSTPFRSIMSDGTGQKVADPCSTSSSPEEIASSPASEHTPLVRDQMEIDVQHTTECCGGGRLGWERVCALVNHCMGASCRMLSIIFVFLAHAM
jgi:hypothetical protein